VHDDESANTKVRECCIVCLLEEILCMASMKKGRWDKIGVLRCTQPGRAGTLAPHVRSSREGRSREMEQYRTRRAYSAGGVVFRLASMCFSEASISVHQANLQQDASLSGVSRILLYVTRYVITSRRAISCWRQLVATRLCMITNMIELSGFLFLKPIAASRVAAYHQHKTAAS
jgi:hypothetical protein